MRTFLRLTGILVSVLSIIWVWSLGLGNATTAPVTVSSVAIENPIPIAPVAIEPSAPSAPTATSAPSAPPAPVPNPAYESVTALQTDLQSSRLDRTKPAPPAVPLQPFDSADLYIHLPPNAAARQPLRVLVALHGMGNRGDVFAPRLIAEADQNGWVLIAPTMRYRDWTDPVQLLQDDLLYTRMVRDTLQVLPERLNLKLRQRALVLGFSRGAQLAERLTLFYPERVNSVAVISAGAYTLPSEKKTDAAGTRVIGLPYGVGDMPAHLGKAVNWDAFTKISYWIGVGERDNRKDDVPRVFDQYVGYTRIERAQVLLQSLRVLGMDAHLTLFHNTDHEMTAEMIRAATKFLRDDEIADNLND